MSAAPQMCENPCETCAKEGLPLLLTRYALMPENAGASKLSGQLDAPELKKVPVGTTAHYGLRLLRSGYVYVFDEKRNHWDEYFVTTDGCLSKMPMRVRALKMQRQPATEFRCARNGAAPLAGVITIRNPKHATNVWIGFSDVEWTDAILDKHQDAGYRKRHMQKIALVGGKVTAQAHTAPLEQADALVPEFKLTAAAVAKHIAPWTPFQFNSRQTQVEAFKAAVQKARPQGGAAIVALHDPAGITAELDALMTHRFNVFTGDAKRMHPLAASQAIAQLEQAIRAQAVEREEAAAEDVANQMLAQPDLGMLFEGYRNKKIKQIEDVRSVSVEEAKRVEERAWQSYAAKFNQAGMTKWREQYEQELQAFDKDYIAPLALAHRDWMKGAPTTHYFACNFDDADLDSGHAYALTVSMCMGNTQDKAACFDLYAQWLGASSFEQSNLLLNAFALNQKKAKDEIAKSADVSLDWRGFSWDALAGAVGESLSGKWDALANAVGEHLVTRAMGPLAKIAEASAAQGRAKLSLVTLSVLAGKPYTVIDVVGSKKRFRELLIQQIIRISKQPLNKKQLQRAVAAEMRRLEIAGEKLDGTQKKRFLIFLDEAQFKSMPANLTAPDKAKWAAQKLQTMEAVEAIEFGHWQAKLGQPRAAMIKGSLPYLVGLIGAIFQYNAMAKLGEDDQKAMSHERIEARYRLHAGVAAFWGTVGDLTGQGLAKAAPLVPKIARGLNAFAIGLKFAGRAAGIIGAGMVAYWDGQAAWKSKRDGQYGMFVLYGASAVLGIGAAGLLLLTGMFAWAGPVALILIGLLIAVAVLIEFFKDNKIQEWLKRCWWGNGPDAKYPDAATEMEQLKLALS